MNEPLCFFFGCWNAAGHYLHAPGRAYQPRARSIEYYGDHIHLDGTLAPRLVRPETLSARTRRGITWQGSCATQEQRHRLPMDSSELPQGQFLRHELDNGYTAIQWWDRCQGDTRGACNSTILLEGRHPSAGMIEALHDHFPHVAENLKKAGIALVDVTLQIDPSNLPTPTV